MDWSCRRTGNAFLTSTNQRPTSRQSLTMMMLHRPFVLLPVQNLKVQIPQRVVIGWWKDAGFVSTTQNVYALTVPLIFIFFPLVFFGTVAMESQRASLFLLAVLFTGISEEAVFRGLFIRAFLPHGKWQAVLIPAVIFGAAHIVQSLGGGMSLGDNLVQIANAFFYGVMMGAVRMRVNNIWPLIMLHALGDLFWVTAGLLDGVFQMSDIPLSHYLIIWIPSIVTAVYLMKKPFAATIDGQPVGMMNGSVIPAVEGQTMD